MGINAYTQDEAERGAEALKRFQMHHKGGLLAGEHTLRELACAVLVARHAQGDERERRRVR